MSSQTDSFRPSDQEQRFLRTDDGCEPSFSESENAKFLKEIGKAQSSGSFSLRRASLAVVGACTLLALSVTAVYRLAPHKPEYARRVDGPKHEVSEEMWEEAKARFQLAKARIEEVQVRALMERRAAEAVAKATLVMQKAPTRELFDFFGLLGGGTNAEEKAADEEIMKDDEEQQAQEALEAKARFDAIEAAAQEKANEAREAFEKNMAEKRAFEQKLADEQKAKLAAIEKKKELRDMEMQLQQKRVQAIEDEKQVLQRVSLYCIALMMPFGYEAGLLLEQKKKGVGIFECDEWEVFTNETRMMDGTPFPFPVSIVPISLYVPLGGHYMTALNRDVFDAVWLEVIKRDNYRKHDWTVKVDPDTVLFPSRLKEVIARRVPSNLVRDAGFEPEKLDCTYCKKEGYDTQTCASHVQWMQKTGSTCEQALEAVSRDAPVDCGCKCDDFACDLPNIQAMYLNNCQYGLHGPIEVFSRRAIATYIAGLPVCSDMLPNPWGEDIFIDQCMMKLGLTRIDVFDLLSEVACGEQPAPCGQTDVSFHPFKNVEKWFACWNFASKYGRGPEDRLQALKVQVADIMEAEKQMGMTTNLTFGP